MTGNRLVRIGIAVTTAMMVGTMLPYAVSVLAPLITVDLGISATDIGLFGTTTMLVATLVSPRAGLLVDHFGPRVTMASLHGAFLIAVVVLANSNGTVMMMAAAIVAGLSISLTNPVTNQVIASHVPPGVKGLVTGIKQAGGQLSAVTAGLGLPLLAGMWGWRSALLAFGIFAPLGLIAMLAVPKSERRVDRGQKAAPAEIDTDVERTLRRLRTFGFLVACGTGPMLYFLPLFVVAQFDASARLAGTAAAMGAVIGTLARLTWGPATERFRNTDVPLTIIGFGAAGGMLLLAASSFVGLSLVWPAVIIVGATGLAFTTPAMLAIMRSVGPEATGSASGKFARSTYAGGVISPVTFGWIIDMTGSYRTAWVVAAVLLATAGMVTWPRHLPAK